MSSTHKDQDRDTRASASRRPRLQNEGGTADDHGRKPGVPSRTGTGSQRPADPERVRRANEEDDGVRSRSRRG